MAKRKASRRAKGSGSIFWHEGRQRWVGRVVVGKKPSGAALTREVWGRTQREVVERMAAAKPPGPDVTVGAWVTHWLTTLAVRSSTRRSYTVRTNAHIVPHLGHRRLADLTAADVEQLAAKLAGTSKLGARTVNGVLGTLRTIFGAAVRAGIVSRNPVSAAKKPKNPRRKVVPWTVPELGRIIAAWDTYSAGAAVALMAACGCRVGEAAALDVPDFDAAAGTVSITKTMTAAAVRGVTIGPPKSQNSARTIRVPAPAMPAIRAAAGDRTAGPLFATRTGKRFPAQNIDGGLRRLLKSLGLKPRGSHILRHSVASQLVAAGVPLADVAKYLGDDVATVVRVYLHPSGTDPADAMERIYGGGQGGD